MVKKTNYKLIKNKNNAQNCSMKNIIKKSFYFNKK